MTGAIYPALFIAAMAITAAIFLGTAIPQKRPVVRVYYYDTVPTVDRCPALKWERRT